MRILFWSELAWPHIGGVEILTHKLMTALRDRGHDLALVTSHADLTLPDERIEDGIAVHRFPMQELFATQRLDLFASTKRRLTRLKQEFRADVTHVNFPCPSVFLHWSTTPADAPPTLLAIHHSLHDLPAGPDTLIGRSLAMASRIVANSRATMDDTLRACPAIADRCALIYNGLDSSAPPSAAPCPEPPRIVCLGRMTREKGFDVALRAFAAVRATIGPCRMTLAGDGPECGELGALARELGLTDAVDFPGWVAPPDVARLFHSATVVLVPSRARETFGLVALEAMQAGRPVIVSDSGALPEIVSDGEAGLVAPAGDVAALADAIARVFADRELAARMGAAGQRRAVERFGFDRYVREYEGLYRQVTHANS